MDVGVSEENVGVTDSIKFLISESNAAFFPQKLRYHTIHCNFIIHALSDVVNAL